MRLRALVTFATAGTVFLACSSSGDASGVPPPADAAFDTPSRHEAAAPEPDGAAPDAETGNANETACTALATASCKKNEECGPSIIRGQFGTVQNCIDRRKLACLGSAAAPGSGFTAATVEACAKSISAETCIQTAHGPHAAVCAQTGSLDEGAPCGFGLQCKSGNCDLAGGTDCSTCTKPFLPMGAACTGFQCEPGLQCVANDCVRASDTGGPCSASQPCWVGAVCVADTCIARAKKGESCASLGCDGRMGLVCDDTSKTCIEATIAKTGEACGPPSCGAGVCKTTTDSGPAGICVARIPDGMTCDTGSKIPCLQASACIGGKCTPFDATNCR